MNDPDAAPSRCNLYHIGQASECREHVLSGLYGDVTPPFHPIHAGGVGEERIPALGVINLSQAVVQIEECGFVVTAHCMYKRLSEKPHHLARFRPPINKVADTE